MHQFQPQQTTTATRATIWAIWRDVARWPEWDTG
jgi:hypothetical protein